MLGCAVRHSSLITQVFQDKLVNIYPGILVTPVVLGCAVGRESMTQVSQDKLAAFSFDQPFCCAVGYRRQEIQCLREV